ncbi:ribosomal protein S12/S23 family protein [Medicago truncatula]|uniref:Ribosomal protein S12/S23 family protein n=1 Tax=Medicago truncatula TaxID=3880 RepID=A0A072TPL7_MEDTR|nr:ribosomal protein S12/S23 family protein [Medicago truncatula]
MISIVDECDIEDQSSIMGIKFKQPNSAICKCARVQLIKNGKKTLPLQDDSLNYIEDGDVDVITGFGRIAPRKSLGVVLEQGEVLSSCSYAKGSRLELSLSKKSLGSVLEQEIISGCA